MNAQQEGVQAFTNQARHCPECGDVDADTILDMDTIVTYWICPECGKAQREGVDV